MYGTVSRLTITPGKLEDLKKMGREMSAQIPGLVSEYVYRTDANPDELYLVAIFGYVAVIATTRYRPPRARR